MSELLNHTRLIPEIFNHTSQLTALWAQVKNMSQKLNAVQEKLENCSFGGGNGHETLQTATPIPTTSPMLTMTPTPTEPGQWRHDTDSLGSFRKPWRRRQRERHRFCTCVLNICTIFAVLWKTTTLNDKAIRILENVYRNGYFSCIPLEVNAAVIACLTWAAF